jgi:branched-chain amino acid transport system ATP-binding protein
MSAPLLELTNVSRHFGGVRAVQNVSARIEAGEIVGLIGPNGAGKTTLVNVITGAHRATGGEIHFMGERVTNQKPYQAARRGLSRTFQIVQPFPSMTVRENVAAGALFAGKAISRRAAMDAAEAHLNFVGLGKLVDAPASTLTLPNRKRLELAKSLAMRPRMLLLDEVNAGLNLSEIDEALRLIREIAAQGVTIIIIEHLMKVVLGLSQRILVLHHGELTAEGAPEDILEDERVIEAYLGDRFAKRRQGAQS